MKLKKLLTSVLTGIMIVAIPVIAGVGSSPATLTAAAEGTEEEGEEDGGENTPETPSSTEPSSEDTSTPTGSSSGNPSSSGSSSGSSSSSSSSSTVAPVRDPEPEEIVEERTVIVDAGSIQAAQIARETGIPTSVSAQAADENKSVGEYMNNVITDVPGLTDVTPVAQGGNVIINGAPTNQTFSTHKPLLVQVMSAQAQATALGGNILNVTNIKGTVSFETATVNFYMPGVKAGQDIQVYQLTNGTWSSVAVSEIREDHVVVDMTSYGVLAFIEVPVQ